MINLSLDFAAWGPIEKRRDDRFRRLSPIAVRPGEGRLTESTPAVQPRSRELVFIPHVRNWRVARRRGATTTSNALWASVDDAEGRWGSRERHIEGGYRLGETFQCQAAEVFECDYFLYGSGDATGDQDLPILRLSTEPSGHVAHGADSGIAGALGKADLAKRRVALGDAGAKTQLTIAAAPVGD